MNDTTTLPEPPLSILPACDLSEVLDRIVPDRPAAPPAEVPLTFNSSI
jgi:hypothetical protein